MVAKRPFGGNSSDENPLEDTGGLCECICLLLSLDEVHFLKAKQSSTSGGQGLVNGLLELATESKMHYENLFSHKCIMETYILIFAPFFFNFKTFQKECRKFKCNILESKHMELEQS